MRFMKIDILTSLAFWPFHRLTIGEKIVKIFSLILLLVLLKSNILGLWGLIHASAGSSLPNPMVEYIKGIEEDINQEVDQPEPQPQPRDPRLLLVATAVQYTAITATGLGIMYGIYWYGPYITGGIVYMFSEQFRNRIYQGLKWTWKQFLTRPFFFPRGGGSPSA